MKIHTAEFVTSASSLDQCPDWDWPEFAFIGRSNVGKSSLINLLAGRRELAMVSATPGKTKLLNFFLLNGRWSLVDLPGYGYARAGKQQSADFNQSVALYLARRANLRHVFVLIDSRLPPQAIDLEFLDWMSGCPAPFSLVFTKIDKQSATQTRANVATFVTRLAESNPRSPAVILSSAKDKSGRAEILGHIGKILAEGA